MEKTFITAQQLLEDSFRVAAQVYESGFRPHFIIGIWRGGAPIGIAVQEYFDFKKVETDHIAVRTSSYYGIGQQSKTIKVHGLHYLIENANSEDSLLIVDDVFDSGRSVEALMKQIKKLSRANMPKDVRIACPYYKPQNNKTTKSQINKIDNPQINDCANQQAPALTILYPTLLYSTLLYSTLLSQINDSANKQAPAPQI